MPKYITDTPIYLGMNVLSVWMSSYSSQSHVPPSTTYGKQLYHTGTTLTYSLNLGDSEVQN